MYAHNYNLVRSDPKEELKQWLNINIHNYMHLFIIYISLYV